MRLRSHHVDSAARSAIECDQTLIRCVLEQIDNAEGEHDAPRPAISAQLRPPDLPADAAIPHRHSVRPFVRPRAHLAFSCLDLAACLQVSKAWRKIASELYLWVRLSKHHAVDVTEVMRTVLEKKFVTPIAKDAFPTFMETESVRKLYTNRLLLLERNSTQCSGAEERTSLVFKDLVFTLDILVDGVVRSTTCFERAHANHLNKLQIGLPLGRLARSAEAAAILNGSLHSVTATGVNLLRMIENKIEVKVSLIRRTDLRMTQIFSYDTFRANKFNWDISVAADDVDFEFQRGDVLPVDVFEFNANPSSWILWLYSNQTCCVDQASEDGNESSTREASENTLTKHSFRVSGASFGEEGGVGGVRGAEAPAQDDSGVGGGGSERRIDGGGDVGVIHWNNRAGFETHATPAASPPSLEEARAASACAEKEHYVLCDVKLGLSLQHASNPAGAEGEGEGEGEGGPEVVLDHVCLMEFFHYWTSGENSFYVELTDKEFLACVERERLWL